MTIREYLEKLGATQSEMSAKVVSRMEQAMLVDTDLEQFKADTVMSLLEGTLEALKNANSAMGGKLIQADIAKRKLEEATANATANMHELQTQTAGLKNAKIEDRDTKDAAMAYAFTLKATQDIFGEENMTENVMIAAINAGSYMAWRSIMGPKENEGSKVTVKPNYRRV